MHTAVVLGAGGMPGEAFHHGVLRALREVAGYDAREADLIVGTSAGSIVAATLRAPDAPPAGEGPHVDDPLPLRVSRPHHPDVVGWLRSAARRPWQLRPASLPLSLLPAGGRSPEAIAEGVRFRHGTRWPQRDTWIIAIRRCDAQRVVFGRDRRPSTDLGTAVAASCAVPLVFSPVVVDGRAHVDGGVHSPTNADLAAKARCDVLIASAPMSISGGERVMAPGVPLRLWWRRQLRRELAPAKRRGALVLTFEPDARLVHALGLHPFNAHRLDDISEMAYELAARKLRVTPLDAEPPAA